MGGGAAAVHHQRERLGTPAPWLEWPVRSGNSRQAACPDRICGKSVASEAATGEDHPQERAESSANTTTFTWSRLGDVNPGPTHYETDSRPQDNEGSAVLPMCFVSSRPLQTHSDQWSWG